MNSMICKIISFSQPSPSSPRFSSPSLTESYRGTSPQTTARREDTPLNCPHFEECPGCITRVSYANIPVVNSAKLFFSSSSIQQKALYPKEDFYQVVIPSEIHGWRTQAKLAVRPQSTWGAGCVFGLYERGSHDIVEIPNCRVHHPHINQAMDILKRASYNVKTPAWDEVAGSNGLRYVQLSVERLTGKVSMTLVWNASNLKQCQPHLSRLIKECKRLDREMNENSDLPSGLFHSIWCNTNDSLGNAIFSRGEQNWHPMEGPEFIREVLPGTNAEERGGLLHFNPMVFRQGNLDGFDEIAMHVARNVGGGSKVCELYAGIGLLGLTALTYWENQGDALCWVRCSDENPNNTRCFKKTLNSMPRAVTGMSPTKPGTKRKGNKRHKELQERTMEQIMEEMLKHNGPSSTTSPSRDVKQRVTYTVASAASALYQGQALGADVLIVDPPRKGLEEEVLVQLCKPHNPKQLYTEDPVVLDGPSYGINRDRKSVV